jgi:hypothetical protein
LKPEEEPDSAELRDRVDETDHPSLSPKKWIRQRNQSEMEGDPTKNPL